MNKSVEGIEITPVVSRDAILSDYKMMQQITGVVAVGGIIFTSISALLSPIDPTKSNMVWLSLAILTIFTCIFFSISKIYMIKQISFLPDVVFSSCFLVLMVNMGNSTGEFIIILLIMLASINAFYKTNWLFILSVVETFIAIVVFYSTTANINSDTSFIDIISKTIGIFALLSILRIFAQETIFLRNERNKISMLSYQLENQRNEILTLIDNLSDGLISVNGDQRITIINNTAVSILSSDSKDEKFVGKLLDDVMPVNLNDERLSLAEDVLKTGKLKHYDNVKLITPRGMFRVATNTTPIIDVDGNRLGAIISFRDITAEKSLEEQRSEFNALASQELRTPLATLEGVTSTILADKRLKYDKKTKEYVLQADKSVRSLMKLTNDILTITRSNDDKIEVVFSEVNIEKTIDSSIEDLIIKAKNKKLELILDFAKDLPIISTDGSKLKEIVFNLTENAIKYTEQGSITISVKNNSDRDVIEVEVKDTGEGISESDQKKLFHCFFRANDFITQKAGGTGLGLYISRTLITAMGGEIGVKSEKGRGSIFWFTIPKIIKQGTRKEDTEEQFDDFVSSI